MARRTFGSVLAAAVLALAAATPAGAQDLQQKLAAAKQSAAQNQQALRSCGWGDALSLTFDSAAKSLRQLGVSTYLDTRRAR